LHHGDSLPFIGAHDDDDVPLEAVITREPHEIEISQASPRCAFSRTMGFAEGGVSIVSVAVEVPVRPALSKTRSAAVKTPGEG
jgi:hypothetical protein